MSLTRLNIRRRFQQPDRSENWKWWEDVDDTSPRAPWHKAGIHKGSEEVTPSIRPTFEPAQIYDFFGHAAA